MPPWMVHNQRGRPQPICYSNGRSPENAWLGRLICSDASFSCFQVYYSLSSSRFSHLARRRQFRLLLRSRRRPPLPRSPQPHLLLPERLHSRRLSNSIAQENSAKPKNEYKALIEQDPQSALAYVGLVRLYLKQKRLSDASTRCCQSFGVGSSTVGCPRCDG